MSTRSEFREIVGLADVPEDEVGLDPSEAIRRLWVRVADSYDPFRLNEVCRYHMLVFHQYINRIGEPTGVMHAFWEMLVAIGAFSGAKAPAIPAMQPQIDAVQFPSWGDIQGAVERLAESWEEVGL